MAIDLSLKNRTDQVFSDYEEKFVGNSIVFEGYLLPHNQEARDAQVIRFISGGRRCLSYELERDGAYVRGVIRYRALAEADPEFIEKSIAKIEAAIGRAPSTRPHTRAVNDAQIDRIRSMHASGMSQRAIARDIGIHYMIVNKIINKKGAYVE